MSTLWPGAVNAASNRRDIAGEFAVNSVKSGVKSGILRVNFIKFDANTACSHTFRVPPL